MPMCAITTISHAPGTARRPPFPGHALAVSSRVRTVTATLGWMAALALTGGAALAAKGEQVGTVDTAFKLIGPDHKIVVTAYDDPRVQGVTCYVSRAKTGGIKGGLGLAEDRSEASIACVAAGPLHIAQPLPQQEEVFSERSSLIFKRLRVVRMVDIQRRTLVYMTYSDRLIDGSPQNSVTAVPVGSDVTLAVKD